MRREQYKEGPLLGGRHENRGTERQATQVCSGSGWDLRSAVIYIHKPYMNLVFFVRTKNQHRTNKTNRRIPPKTCRSPRKLLMRGWL